MSAEDEKLDVLDSILVAIVAVGCLASGLMISAVLYLAFGASWWLLGPPIALPLAFVLRERNERLAEQSRRRTGRPDRPRPVKGTPGGGSLS